MGAIDSFSEEHRLIRQVLDAFDAYVSDAQAGGPADRQELRRFVSFFENFAHLHHHDKEESLLLPALALAGLDWNAEPLSRIRAEHDQEQYLIRSLCHLAWQADDWSADDRLHFLSVAKTFIAFQRDHMRFENTEIYPHVAKLSEAARMRLSRDIERFDENLRTSNQRFVVLGRSLVRRDPSTDAAICVGNGRATCH